MIYKYLQIWIGPNCDDLQIWVEAGMKLFQRFQERKLQIITVTDNKENEPFNDTVPDAPPSWSEAGSGGGECSATTDHWRVTSKKRRSSRIVTSRQTSKRFLREAFRIASRSNHCSLTDFGLPGGRSHYVPPHGAHFEGSLCELARRCGWGLMP